MCLREYFLAYKYQRLFYGPLSLTTTAKASRDCFGRVLVQDGQGPVCIKYLVEELRSVYLAQLWEESIYQGIEGILD